LGNDKRFGVELPRQPRALKTRKSLACCTRLAYYRLQKFLTRVRV